jgi:hypothetical protein
LILVACVAPFARAQESGGITATGATVDKVGWWSKSNVATETPAAIVTVPRPPSIPAGTLAVGAQAGDESMLAAVGILPDAEQGDTVTAFTLVMKEMTSPGANVNSAAAKLAACPITAFWVGGENGLYANRPTFDCDAAKAPGARAADGTWTFDLLPIGTLWLDPFGTTAPDGVVIVEDAAAPDSFQVDFATAEPGSITVTFQFTPGADDGGALTGDTVPSFDGGGDISTPSFEGPSIGSADIPVGGLPTPGETTTTAAPSPTTTAAPKKISSSAGEILGNMPGGLLLLFPAVFVLLGLLSFSLGPAGDPVTTIRQRGVSRALAARERAHANPSEMS